MSTLSAVPHRRWQPRRACKKQKKEENAPAASLHLDVLSAVFLFLDVGDVPGVAAACREWNQMLQMVESDLWLGLVRKHHPIVERITRLLPTSDNEGSINSSQNHVPSESAASSAPEGSSVGASETAGQPGEHESSTSSPASASASASASGSALPPPSLHWKTQFQRRHAIVNSASSGSRIATTPACRPLSAYFVQVDLICYKERGGSPRARVGVASTIVEDLKYSDGRMELCLDDLNEELSRLSFDTFDMTIHLFQRASGKQTVLYHGSPEERWDFNEMFCTDFSGFNCHPILSTLHGAFSTYVLLRKNGCLCTCADESSFFELPRPCSCCSEQHCSCCDCKKRWDCFFKYKLVLRIQVDYDWDSLDVDDDDLLLVFERGLVYH